MGGARAPCRGATPLTHLAAGRHRTGTGPGGGGGGRYRTGSGRSLGGGLGEELARHGEGRAGRHRTEPGMWAGRRVS